jgi:hypothetical protein
VIDVVPERVTEKGSSRSGSEFEAYSAGVRDALDAAVGAIAMVVGGTLVWDEGRSDDDRDIGWGDCQDAFDASGAVFGEETGEEGADADIDRLRAACPPHHIDRDIR